MPSASCARALGVAPARVNTRPDVRGGGARLVGPADRRRGARASPCPRRPTAVAAASRRAPRGGCDGERDEVTRVHASSVPEVPATVLVSVQFRHSSVRLRRHRGGMDLLALRRPLLAGLVGVLALLLLAQRLRRRRIDAGACAAPMRRRSARRGGRAARVSSSSTSSAPSGGGAVPASRREPRSRTRCAWPAASTAPRTLELVNLAAPLADGEQVLVPRARRRRAAGAPPGATTPVAPLQLSVATARAARHAPGHRARDGGADRPVPPGARDVPAPSTTSPASRGSVPRSSRR